MPLYEYSCTACDFKFQEVMKVDDRDLPVGQKCPGDECSGGSLRRLPTSPAIVSSVGTIIGKVPADFRAKLKAIKDNNPGSKINC